GLTAQEEVKKLADQYGAENLIIIFGLNQPFNLQIMATTFKSGDPSFAGPLAGIALNIPSYHILELQDQIPPDVWDSEMGMYELELEEETQEKIKGLMREIRG
ncbi:MAG: glycine/sarcosine/betaine reductase complex selenoprotein A, partial [Desulfobulbaceae bacterium]|nr:glycine/sarcosine/betaine reductase complex selenoprotein A [Desulfobulbaceae bacterium]